MKKRGSAASGRIVIASENGVGDDNQDHSPNGVECAHRHPQDPQQANVILYSASPRITDHRLTAAHTSLLSFN